MYCDENDVEQGSRGGLERRSGGEYIKHVNSKKYFHPLMLSNIQPDQIQDNSIQVANYR